MNCEKCGAKGAHFMGVSTSYGPSECDAQNTTENLPGGFAWLCEDCAWEIELAAMDENQRDEAAA